MGEVQSWLQRYRSNFSPPVNIEERVRFNANLSRSWFGAVISLIDQITMLGVLLTGAALIRERERGTVEHLLVMPVTPFEIMTSKIWSMGLVVLVTSALSMRLVVQDWLAVPIQGSIPLFVCGAALHLFAVTSLGMFLATFARTMPQFALLMIMVLLPLQVLDGGLTPRESMPEFVQQIMLAAPTTHFVMLAQGILYRGAGLERRLAAVPRPRCDRHGSLRHRARTLPQDDRVDGVSEAEQAPPARRVPYMALVMTFRENGQATVVELAGDLDSSVSLRPEDKARLFALLKPGCRITLDVSKLRRVSPVGLRLLLLLYRSARALGAVSFVGERRELVDLAEATGFVDMAQGPSPDPLSAWPWLLWPRIDIYPTHQHAGFALQCGHPFLPGAWPVPGGVNFVVFSRHAHSCTLVLFEHGAAQPTAEIPFAEEFRVGHVFCMFVFGLSPEQFQYGYRMDGPWAPEQGHRFDPSKVLLDPFAACVAGGEVWGERASGDGLSRYRASLVPEDFDWEGDRPLGLPFTDLVIYEMHVRGFTRSPTSGVKFPGTFAGLREKIPFLKELGINCVELMPIFEFDECEVDRRHPRTGERLFNYWGYNTLAFCAPKAGYAASGRAGMQVDEFKSLVKELHKNGIEVILDVVFNHTAEGGEDGPTLSFRGLDNRTWYLLTPEGRYQNFSGCGNTLNCNHPVVREFVLELSALVGRGVPHRRVPVRPGQHPRPGRERCGPAQSTAAGGAGRRSDPGDDQTHRRGLGRRRPLPGRQLSGLRAVGRMERALPRLSPQVPQGRPGTGRRDGQPAGRLAGPVRHAGAGSVGQLRHLPRRLHPGRPGQLQRQAQRGQRRGQPRRRHRQLLLELRRRGPHG